MKPEQLYQELIDLAEKLDIKVSEQNLRKTGTKIGSGLCKVKGNYLFIIDKHKSIHKKVKILAAQLANMPHENIFIIPAVRALLDKYAKVQGSEVQGLKVQSSEVQGSKVKG